MASKVERLRKAYEFKLGKKLVSKLSDEQIKILSSFYNSLSEDEQRSIDSDIFKGKSNDLIDMARAFVEENEEPPSAVATEEAPPPSGALALYEGTREDDLVDEEVDERILKLLGLEEVFDIDYGTYLTLLKEQMIAARMTDKKLSTEESELLTNEFKRVKGKVGRFKLKKKKIAAESLGVTGAIKVSPQKFFLTSKAIIPEPVSTTEASPETTKEIKDISEALDELLKNIRLENEMEKKKEEKERKQKEKSRRKAREEELEKPVKKVLSGVKKVIAPFESILDRILKFLGFTFLGYFLNNILPWFTDPENKEKVETLTRFLKDWWPALSAAALVFLTPFGGFVRGTIALVSGLGKQLLGLVKLMAANPITSAAVLGALGAAASAVINEQKREEFAATDPTIVTPEQTRETGKTPGASQLQQEQILQRGLGGAYKGGGVVPRAKSFFGGGGVNNDVDVNDIDYSEGGGIDNESGIRIKGAGPDTQLIAAQPGEVVMSKSAVDKYGANFLLDLNRRAGGTNIPRMVNNIQLAAGGGMVGKATQHLQKDEALSSLTKGSNDFIKPGGMSVISGRNWNSIKPDTMLHAYLDSVNQPTIGWGSTFYDSILNGKSPVRMGDTITKKRADGILQTNLSNLAKTYAKEMPYWKKMSDSQKAGTLVIGYNAPYGPIGSFPKLTQALSSGDMISASKNVDRGGPSKSRLEIERSLLLNGPKDLTKVKQFVSAEKPTNVKPVGPKSIPQSLSDDEGFSKFIPKPIRKLFGNQSSVNLQSQSSINLQSQSSVNLQSQSMGNVKPVGTPVVSTQSKTIVLPPQKIASQKPGEQINTGSQLPEFSSISNVPYRGMMLRNLGIEDLMGVG